MVINNSHPLHIHSPHCTMQCKRQFMTITSSCFTSQNLLCGNL